MGRWKSWDSAPKNGDEILVRYPRQGNVKILARYSAIYGYWSSKGEPVLGIDNQECEWCAVPDDADCDAYEARIAELERTLLASAEETQRTFNAALSVGLELKDARAELARVKAESLRVVKDGEPCLLGDSGPFFMLYEGVVYSYGEHNAWYEVSDPFRCCHASPAATVTPVRLERWEEVG